MRSLLASFGAVVALAPAAIALQTDLGGNGDRPPRVKIEALQAERFLAGRDARFRVTVADPEGGPVSAVLELGPRTMAMRPIVNEASPAVRELRWFADVGGESTLIVAARDASRPQRVVRERLRFDAKVVARTARSGLLDLDGDLRPELLAFSSRSAPDGAICVFSSPGVVSGSADLRPSIWRNGTGSKYYDYFEFELAPQIDLDLDGTLDLVTKSGVQVGSSYGVVHLFRGGASTANDRVDDAMLLPAAWAFWDYGEYAYFERHDVTGDGREDLIVVAPFENAGWYFPGGASVFAADAALGATVALTAKCTLTRNHDHYLGSSYFSQTIDFADVTGDGHDDLLIATPNAAVGSSDDAGAVAVFAGGPALLGTVAPTALLASPTPKSGTLVSGLPWSRAFELADFDGDGVLDVLVPSPNEVGGGALFLFRGGATLTGTPVPLATLSVPGGVTGDLLGDIAAGSGIAVGDVTGDGLQDVVAASSKADRNGVVDCGAVFVWSGAAGWSGAMAPTFVLGDAIAQTSAQLCRAAEGLRLIDANGDGVLDVVTTDPFFDVNGVVDAGAIHVWSSAGGWTAPIAPTATLVSASPAAGDLLGRHDNGGGSRPEARATGFLRRDLDGDGSDDWVVGSHRADVNGVVDAGSVQLFATGPTLAGTVTPFAVLAVPGAKTGDSLGFDGFEGSPDGPLLCADVTGDGQDDLVVRASLADVGALVDAGACHVWAGGAAIAGTPAPRASLFGSAAGGLFGSHAVIGDVDADGVLDLVIRAVEEPVGTVARAGRTHVFRGGATLAGSPAAHALLVRVPAQAYEGYGKLQLHDFDRDGVNDVLWSAWFADDRGADKGGLILWWPDAQPAANGSARVLRPPVPSDDDAFGF